MPIGLYNMSASLICPTGTERLLEFLLFYCNIVASSQKKLLQSSPFLGQGQESLECAGLLLELDNCREVMIHVGAGWDEVCVGHVFSTGIRLSTE